MEGPQGSGHDGRTANTEIWWSEKGAWDHRVHGNEVALCRHDII